MRRSFTGRLASGRSHGLTSCPWSFAKVNPVRDRLPKATVRCLRRLISNGASVLSGGVVTPPSPHTPLKVVGPSKGGLGAGRARRWERVIMVKKIDVNVTQIGVSPVLGKIGQKQRLSTENRSFPAQKPAPWKALKRPFLVTWSDMKMSTKLKCLPDSGHLMFSFR
jgi:hypothetical protein